MEKYNNQYRIPSARASWWDYAAPADYFITICITQHQCLLGHIITDTAEMIASPIGKIVAEEWQKSFDIRNELSCDAFIMMPNHLHAIVKINAPVETHGRASPNSNPNPNPPSHSPPSPNPTTNSPQPPETHSRASLQKQGVAHRLPKSIASFVAGFKSAATKRINQYRNLPQTPVWQSRFYDHVIRNAQEYDRIKQYIETNPQRWQADKFYVETHGGASHT